jgi:hypothetical protein
VHHSRVPGLHVDTSPGRPATQPATPSNRLAMAHDPRVLLQQHSNRFRRPWCQLSLALRCCLCSLLTGPVNEGVVIDGNWVFAVGTTRVPFDFRVHAVRTKNAKARFSLPIWSYIILEKRRCGSLVARNSSVGPIPCRIEWRQNRSIK